MLVLVPTQSGHVLATIVEAVPQVCCSATRHVDTCHVVKSWR